MRREYLESMQADGPREFIQACDELKNCKYVLAENKIAALLKSVADNKQLYSMFGTIMYGFDYKRVFNTCVAGRGFALPLDKKKAIALVFRVLLDVDSGKMPLKNFLEAYFYCDLINESYARFALEVIAPFESYCKEYFSSGGNLVGGADDDGDGAYGSDGDMFQDSLKADALTCVNDLSDVADSSITGAVDRAEFAACLDGLTKAIRTRGYGDVISAFIGVKYAVAYFFGGNEIVAGIFKKLEYDIKHISE